MKLAKKILIGSLATLGISSLIAVGCGLAFSNVNLTTKTTITNQNAVKTLASQPNSDVLNNKNVTDSQVGANSSSVNAPMASPSVSANAAAISQANQNNNQVTSQNITNPNNLAYHTLDTSTLATNQTSTFTYKCANGNTLLFSVNSTNENTATVLGFSVKVVSTALVIPNTVVNGNNFYAVTSIGAGAFYGQNLTSITFNANLQTIGTLAFADNNLTSLDLPSGLQSIGEKAFISNQFPHAYAVNLGPNTQ